MTPQASNLVTFGMVALAVGVAGLFVWGFAATAKDAARGRRFTIGLIGVAIWMTSSAVLAKTGVLAQFDQRPPPLAILLVTLFAISIMLGLSPVGRDFAERLPFAPLILAQSFRFPLELIMHQAAREGVMPNQMSYAGMNFDIVTGIGALVVGLLVLKGKVPRGLIMAWNIAGILLLVNILGVAIASLPFIHAFGSAPERVNSWVAYFPFVWLAGVLVPAALFGHLVITRKLLAPLPKV